MNTCPRCGVVFAVPACPTCHWVVPTKFLAFDASQVCMDIPGEPVPFPTDANVVHHEDDALLPDDDPALSILFKAPTKRPLVFVPGIMGSRLFAHHENDRREIWPPPVGGNIDFDAVALQLCSLSVMANDGVGADVPRKQDGAIHRPDVGSMVPGAYEPLIEFLHKLGYREHIDADHPAPDYPNLLVFPYDWRHSNDTSGSKLVDAVTAFLAEHNSQVPSDKQWSDVDVVCHSMGGLVTRRARLTLGPVIRRVVFIATPHHGTPKPFRYLASTSTNSEEIVKALDDTWGPMYVVAMWWGRLLGVVSADTKAKIERCFCVMKQAIQSMPGVYELLPDKRYFGVCENPFHSTSTGDLGFAESYFSPPQNIQLNGSLIAAALGGPAHGAFSGTTGFKEKIASATILSVDHLFAAKDSPTVYKVELDSGKTGIASITNVVGPPGDGTVVLQSAVARDDSFGWELFVGADHGQLPNDRRVHQRLAQILKA